MDLNLVKQRAKRINQGVIEELFKKTLLENKERYVEFVRQRWLRGKKPNGDIIGEYNNFAYQQEKLAMNPLAGGTVDLHLTGALSAGLDIFPVAGGNFNIFSTDEKAITIADKYGIEVYGVTPAEEKIIIELTSSEVNTKLYNFVMNGRSL